MEICKNCDHSKNMHVWHEADKRLECVYLYHDGPCTCTNFEATPPPPPGTTIYLPG